MAGSFLPIQKADDINSIWNIRLKINRYLHFKKRGGSETWFQLASSFAQP